MRRLILAAGAVLAIAAPGLATPAVATMRPAVAAKVCHRGISAHINGRTKCLQAGEYCARGAERQYERYGFECSTRYRPPRLRRA
jgi:hypothetical protein